MFPIRDDQPSFTKPFVNYLIIGLNVLVFLFEQWVGLQSPRAYLAFIYEFGIVPRHVTHALGGAGDFSIAAAFLPILTSMFVHGGWMHIIGNLWFLWIFGDNIEDRLGHFRYLIFYLLCGIVATLAHAFFNPGSRMPSIGASGAIAGVLGAYLLLFPRAQVTTLIPIFFFITIREIPAFIILGLWFVLQLFTGVASLGVTEGNTG